MTTQKQEIATQRQIIVAQLATQREEITIVHKDCTDSRISAQPTKANKKEKELKEKTLETELKKISEYWAVVS